MLTFVNVCLGGYSACVRVARGITPTGILQHLKMMFRPSLTSELGV